MINSSFSNVFHNESIHNENNSVQTNLQETKEKLEKIAKQSKLLAKTRAIYPFQLFPDEIYIETDKITVVHRTLWFKTVHPIPIANLLSVTVTRGFLFASISFEITGFEKNPGDITHLWPKDAALTKRYIVGLIQALRQNVDLSEISPAEVREYIEEIGKTAGEIERSPIS